jgi:hypothetical protein
MMEPSICVVHLVRAQNGIEPLGQFLSSYHKHGAGIGHDLLLALKGFPRGERDAEFERLLDASQVERIFLPDWGYDISAYFRVAEARRGPRHFCFLNSFSEVLADDWLLKLYDASASRSAGVVGATGSYQGFHKDWKSIPNRDRFSARSSWKSRLLALPFVEEMNELGNRMLSPEFPNPHVRTNGFLIERETMLALHPRVTLTKRHSYGFESGWNSMTRQILGMNKSVHIVGRDGTVYDIDEWKHSDTFWQGEQKNLLVSDRQTKRYQVLDPEAREVFRRYAWGEVRPINHKN